ncbi:hypothetical protein NEOLEDRAFT_937436 [Neolentinus lepideus HHB14362 ss-1]|uniref:Uncharacterized protein n=1 Tax=Neolentinus lepideus HHB14362 ss-1 TaxID=1314782 RepID=A0A165NGW6_9AGAM|nr:hypothetical protein NEOLEDRAFT_937436 [Neolentinus lepideus HHB14362 ss-1]
MIPPSDTRSLLRHSHEKDSNPLRTEIAVQQLRTAISSLQVPVDIFYIPGVRPPSFQQTFRLPSTPPITHQNPRTQPLVRIRRRIPPSCDIPSTRAQAFDRPAAYPQRERPSSERHAQPHEEYTVQVSQISLT